MGGGQCANCYPYLFLRFTEMRGEGFVLEDPE